MRCNLQIGGATPLGGLRGLLPLGEGAGLSRSRPQGLGNAEQVATHSSYGLRLMIKRPQLFLGHGHSVLHARWVHDRITKRTHGAVKIEQFADFPQSESQLLSGSNPFNRIDIALSVGAVTRRGARRGFQKPAPLIKANCGDFDAGSFSEFPDFHGGSINLAPWFRLKRFCERDGFARVEVKCGLAQGVPRPSFRHGSILVSRESQGTNETLTDFGSTVDRNTTTFRAMPELPC